MFGRDLAPSEQVLLLAFLTPVVSEDSGDGGSATAPAVAVEERTPRTTP